MPIQGVRSTQGNISRPRNSVPGWIASLVLHALLLAGSAIGLKSCQEDTGDGPGQFRPVGLVVKSHVVAPAQERLQAADKQATETASDTPENSTKTASVDQLLELPATAGPPILGPGPRAPQADSSHSASLLPRGVLSSGGPLSGLIKGETRFLGIRDKGTRFVYVLDRSASMFSHHALEVAKAELIASIRQLDETQQFQVVFYNKTFSLLSLGKKTNTVYTATEINKRLASQQIAAVMAAGGTQHYPALRKALSLEPEVIYFLTDADVNTQLAPGELAKLIGRNRGRCRIHAIKFGLGAELINNHNVKQLALRNGGKYRYRDVRTFSNR